MSAINGETCGGAGQRTCKPTPLSLGGLRRGGGDLWACVGCRLSCLHDGDRRVGVALRLVRHLRHDPRPRDDRRRNARARRGDARSRSPARHPLACPFAVAIRHCSDGAARSARHLPDSGPRWWRRGHRPDRHCGWVLAGADRPGVGTGGVRRFRVGGGNRSRRNCAAYRGRACRAEPAARGLGDCAGVLVRCGAVDRVIDPLPASDAGRGSSCLAATRSRVGSTAHQNHAPDLRRCVRCRRGRSISVLAREVA